MLKRALRIGSMGIGLVTAIGLQAQNLTFATPAGDRSSLASYHGKVLAVAFIAPQACPRCEQLTVTLNSLRNQYWSRGFEAVALVIGLNNTDQLKAISDFGGQHDISLPLGFVSSDAARTFLSFPPGQNWNVPQVVMLGRDGTVQASSVGAGNMSLVDPTELQKRVVGFLDRPSFRPETNTLWLDASLSAWNHPGSPVPKGHWNVAADKNPLCASQGAVIAGSAEAQLVARAGWQIQGKENRQGPVVAVLASSNADGMCRPMDYQYFIFLHGTFAGSVSPSLMDSRTDGSAIDLRILGDSAVTVDFARYSANDGLCCPSSISRVTFAIETHAGQFSLVPKQVQRIPRG